ncbi:MAG: MATE family efflux transporter, partial [Gammaproteobacteria bacterium]
VSIYCLAPHWIISWDLSQDELQNQLLINLASVFLILTGIYQVLDGVRVMLSASLRAMKNSLYPLYINFITFWLVALPVGCIFAFILKWQVMGLWGALLFALVLSIFLQYRKLYQQCHVRAIQ